MVKNIKILDWSRIEEFLNGHKHKKNTLKWFMM